MIPPSILQAQPGCTQRVWFEACALFLILRLRQPNHLAAFPTKVFADPLTHTSNDLPSTTEELSASMSLRPLLSRFTPNFA
jgi:hypothetical protein